mmetsp:Transcript_22015/g.89373  ORF Transcript_22015/g.89373 Transcript_22015/m.89373 type:complete len:97 (-) Transcript_22015:2955-3245(-)
MLPLKPQTHNQGYKVDRYGRVRGKTLWKHRALNSTKDRGVQDHKSGSLEQANVHFMTSPPFTGRREHTFQTDIVANGHMNNVGSASASEAFHGQSD